MSDTPPASGATEDVLYGGVRSTIRTTRETAKWVLAAFAGVGALLVAGLRLSDLGRLAADSGRLGIALLSLLTALCFVGWAILRAARVIGVPFLTLHELNARRRRAIREARARGLPPSDDLAAAVDPLFRALRAQPLDLFHGRAENLADLQRKLNGVYRALRSLRARQPAPWGGRSWTYDDIDQLEREAASLQRIVFAVIDWANDWVARDRFARLPGAIFIAGLAVALNLAIFAWAVNPSGLEAAARVDAPIPVTVYLDPPVADNPAASAALDAIVPAPERRVRPHACLNDLDRLAAIAVAGDLRTPEVVVTPQGSCPALQFRVTSDVGVVVPVQDADPPQP